MLGDSDGSTGTIDMSLLVEKPRQDVVAVGSDDQPRHRQPHPARRPGGEDVAEIAGGDG